MKKDCLYHLPCGKTLLIKEKTLNKIDKYKQLGSSDLEAGGILIGRILIENNNYIIDDVTTPMPKDTRTRHRFKRKSKGHQEYYNDLFYKSDGRCFYLGEWHTHPENVPSPSFLDKRNWKRLSGLGFENEHLFFIILGIKELKVWCISKQDGKIFLLESED